MKVGELKLPPGVKIPDAEQQKGRPLSTRQKMTVGLLSVYVSWQLLFPLRQFLYPGDPSWTEEGQQFAWRMMLSRKDFWIRYYVTVKSSGETLEFPISRIYHFRQGYFISVSPDHIVEAAHVVGDIFRRQGIDVEVRVVSLVSLNGRKPQLLVDPELDMTTVHRTWRHKSWIIPLTEPRREESWSMEVNQWPEAVGIELPQTVQF